MHKNFLAYLVVYIADETVYELTVPTDQDLSLMEKAFSVLAQFACAIRSGHAVALPSCWPLHAVVLFGSRTCMRA